MKMNLFKEIYLYLILRTSLIRGLSSLKMQDESIQSLTECLCDGKTMPLLHDPLVKEVVLRYEALPHYQQFVKKWPYTAHRAVVPSDSRVYWCMVLHGFAWYWLVLHGIAWN